MRAGMQIYAERCRENRLIGGLIGGRAATDLVPFPLVGGIEDAARRCGLAQVAVEVVEVGHRLVQRAVDCWGERILSQRKRLDQNKLPVQNCAQLWWVGVGIGPARGQHQTTYRPARIAYRDSAAPHAMSSSPKRLSFTSPLKGLGERISESAKKAKFILNKAIGNTPLKAFRQAVLAGDEKRAIEIYCADMYGSSLQEDLYPSMPFPHKKFNYETPLHLGCEMGLKTLYLLLLEHGGVPSTLNQAGSTCLHSVCSRGDHSQSRYDLLLDIVAWRGSGDANNESVSINHVDSHGNSAIHYAAFNGLGQCVEKLIELGAIISIVNRSQQTCCEMADEGGFKDLANMLELALVHTQLRCYV